MRKREAIARLVDMTEQLVSVQDDHLFLRERLAELELAIEDTGWERIGGEGSREFSRESIRKVADWALYHYLKNPLTNHGVEVNANYVFGQGVTITGESEQMDKLWRLFWEHPYNRMQLSSPPALAQKEIDFQIEGNLFFALFTSKVNGAVRVRSMPPNEIMDVVNNPEDSQEPWYYLRRWRQPVVGSDGLSVTGEQERTALYPAWLHRPKPMPPALGKVPIVWDAPVYHRKVGGTSHWKFGLSEIYSALDWAKATKKAMEDYATVRSNLARFASTLTTKGGPKGVAAAKAKLGTKIGSTGGETNPAAVTGSTLIAAEGWKYDILKTAGAQASPEEARYLFVLTAAGHGLPFSILTGDADKSNLATAKSLDRPTELKMRMRQILWATIFRDLATYLLMASIRATKGVVKGRLIPDEWGVERPVIEGSTPAKPIPTGVTVEFPPILEHDVDARVKAIVSAATLDGKPDAGTFDKETLVRQLASALGIEDVDALIDEVLGMGEVPPAEDMTQEAQFIEVLKEVREVLRANAA